MVTIKKITENYTGKEMKKESKWYMRKKLFKHSDRSIGGAARII